MPANFPRDSWGGEAAQATQYEGYDPNHFAYDPNQAAFAAPQCLRPQRLDVPQPARSTTGKTGSQRFARPPGGRPNSWVSCTLGSPTPTSSYLRNGSVVFDPNLAPGPRSSHLRNEDTTGGLGFYHVPWPIRIIGPSMTFTFEGSRVLYIWVVCGVELK